VSTCRLMFALSMLPAAALADAPAFDRPGFAFATSTLPPGSLDWEQGLPDLQRDSADGARSTIYTADTMLRFGVTPTLELEISSSPWNRLDVRAGGTTTQTQGAGDSGFAVKWAPALASNELSLAFLGAVTLDTGASAFTNGRPSYSLGATVGRDLGAGRTMALYTNVNHSEGTNTWTLSPSFGFPLTEQIGGYVEAGRIARGAASSTLAGGGLTLLLHDHVQFDLYARGGVTSSSPDLQAGFGICVLWN
jgi:hypothetical protein